MIAVQAASYMQSLINSATLASALDTTTDLFKRSAVQDSLSFVDQHAVAHDFKAGLTHMLSSDDDNESKSNTGKPARKLTRRQLKHREAMVRFRQRKKAKIAVLEEEELRLQAELDEKLREYKRRVARQPSAVGLVGVTHREKMLHRSFVDTVVQIERILDENEALEEAIAVHDKFHGTLKRVRERIVETSVWKCV